MISLVRLTEILAEFSRLQIGLIGDLFLDRYLVIPHGAAELSIETGREAYQVVSVRNSPGALGTVMNNLASLGARLVKPVTVIGDDGHGFDLLRSLDSLPVDKSHILQCGDRLTPTYTKPLQEQRDGVWRELNRLDVRTRGPLNDATRQDLLRHVDAVVSTTDGLIVMDQISEENQGVVDDQVRRHLAEICRAQPDRLVFVDSRSQLHQFSFAVLKGNQSEIVKAAGDGRDAKEATLALAKRTGRAVFCTIGEHGTLAAEASGQVTRVPGYLVPGPVDIVGAGDSATAGMVLALLAGANVVEAAAIGNLVASVTVQQLGTTGTASPEQVLARWHEVDQFRAESPGPH
jgi:rfaE bifunctional protein kinase chain/domain